MESIISKVKEVKKYTEAVVNIPFTNIIFLCTLLLIWKPKYVDLIDASSWVPKNLKNIILDLANSLYSNIGIIFSLLVGIFIILLLLTSKTEIFNKVLPKEKIYSDNTSVSWNEYSAINKIVRIIISLATTVWIYYFLINIIFNEENYVSNFLIDNSSILNNELILSGYMTINNLQIMNTLFTLNVIITVYFVIRSLFVIKLHFSECSINSENINSYIQLNSFQQKNSMGEKFDTIIFKTKYRKKVEFLLINVQITQRRLKSNNETKWGDVEIPHKKRIYRIIDHSYNLDEIVYHFESIKNRID